MYIKTFVPGSRVVPVPVGIPVCLGYNEKGILSKCYYYETSGGAEFTHAHFHALYQNKCAPITIPENGGTTTVYGVLYCGKLFPYEDHVVSNEYQNHLSGHFLQHADQFKFFAGSVKCTGLSLTSYMQIKMYLNRCGFNVLSSILIPARPTKESFEYQINGNNQFPFIYPMICGYFVFDNETDDTFRFVHSNLKQFIVRKLIADFDEFGHVICRVSGSIYACTIDYSTALKFDIRKGSCVVLDSTGAVIYCYNRPDMQSKLKTNITCPVCGRTIVVNESDTVQCEINCLSRQYPNFKRFIDVYGLPDMRFEYYLNLIESKELRSLVDIFKLKEYENYIVDTTLYRLLRTLVPIQDVPVDDVISDLVKHCNNNVNTLEYYIDNTSQIQIDFHLTGRFVTNLIQWFSNDKNKELLRSLLDCDHIILKESDKKFEGAPIFRNKTILISGDFVHGSQEDIASILRSYSAKVVYEFDPSIDCILLGDTHENINGVYVRKCRDHNIPVFEEFDFFKKYEIDQDLAENLVS